MIPFANVIKLQSHHYYLGYKVRDEITQTSTVQAQYIFFLKMQLNDGLSHVHFGSQASGVIYKKAEKSWHLNSWFFFDFLVSLKMLIRWCQQVMQGLYVPMLLKS